MAPVACLPTGHRHWRFYAAQRTQRALVLAVLGRRVAACLMARWLLVIVRNTNAHFDRTGLLVQPKLELARLSAEAPLFALGDSWLKARLPGVGPLQALPCSAACAAAATAVQPAPAR